MVHGLRVCLSFTRCPSDITSSIPLRTSGERVCPTCIGVLGFLLSAPVPEQVSVLSSGERSRTDSHRDFVTRSIRTSPKPVSLDLLLVVSVPLSTHHPLSPLYVLPPPRSKVSRDVRSDPRLRPRSSTGTYRRKVYPFVLKVRSLLVLVLVQSPRTYTEGTPPTLPHVL